MVGSKADTRTEVGPLINEAAAERVERWVDEAVAGGATVHTGAKREGAYYWPTVLTSVPRGARVLADEVFGPVVSMEPFDSVDAVVSTSTDSTTDSRPASSPATSTRHSTWPSACAWVRS